MASIFQNQAAQSQAQAQHVGRGGSFLDRAQNWLERELEFAKGAINEAAAKRFRESKTGQEFISEVKDQEINATLQNLAPVIGLVGIAIALMKR